MDDLTLLGWIVAGLFALVGVVTMIATHEAQKRKPNIRVPRETLWERTRKFHG